MWEVFILWCLVHCVFCYAVDMPVAILCVFCVFELLVLDERVVRGQNPQMMSDDQYDLIWNRDLVYGHTAVIDMLYIILTSNRADSTSVSRRTSAGPLFNQFKEGSDGSSI